MKQKALALASLILMPATFAEIPFEWLETLNSPKVDAWVEARNLETFDRFLQTDIFNEAQAATLAILDSDERLVVPSLRGDHVYHFHRNEAHPRGIWRRALAEAFFDNDPEWKTLLDLDALATEEDENWVWNGALFEPRSEERVIIRLSRGGADAVVLREFDLATGAFVKNGFFLPETKVFASWRDRDHLFVSADLGAGTATRSGYGRQARLWQRGTPIEAADILLDGEEADVSVSAFRWEDGDRDRFFATRATTFFTRRNYQITEEGAQPVPLPDDVILQALFREQLVFTLRTEAELGGHIHPSGTLLATDLDALMAGEADFHVLFEPTERASVARVDRVRDYLVLSTLENVRSRLYRIEFFTTSKAWQRTPLRAEETGSLAIASTSQESNRLLYRYTDFITPNSLYLLDVETDEHRLIRTEPTWFDASGLIVEQWRATSTDGTEIPYFIVLPKDWETRGSLPTLLYGYGGFGVSQRPFYSGLRGKMWLQRGHAFVLANIRGGGEFGPDWHQSVRRENRQQSFDDFIAVAEDLIERGVTTSRQLGIQGGSQGGLLVGVAMVQRPDLFNAVVSMVPLLDMLRFHRLLAGASWIAEYGDPDDPADREFIAAYSPLQNLRPGVGYPEALFTTSTRDDRVHPAHARRMVARLMELEQPVLYYENTEGGHGGAANHPQIAKLQGLIYAYLFDRLLPTAANGHL
ncbi:MAG: S9 family peptidase [Opitutales bacterium]|nr:S9 family peptidase [Opitutales bacterium]